MNNSDQVVYKSGDMIAKAGTSFLAKIVRLVTLSNFSHVGVVIVEDDGVFVVEADRPVVKKTPIEELYPLYHIPMGMEEVSDDLKHSLESHIGSRYSIFQAALSFFNIYIDDDRWYCTEIAYEFYTKAGFDVKEKLTPTKFIKEVLKIRNVVRYITTDSTEK